MKAEIRAIFLVLAFATLPIKVATGQSASLGCSLEKSVNGSQIIRCKGGVVIVAEDGARYTLQDRDRNGEVDSAQLSSKALLLEVPKKSGGKKFQVITPQAIAAVRGTRWAVDAVENKTSVFVVSGTVVVRRTSSDTVTLGPGEGVDVETAGPLTLKRWPQARVSSLMVRLGQ